MSSPSPLPSLNSDQASNNSSTVGEAITALVVVVFILFVVALILYIRAKNYVGITGRMRRGLVFAPGPSPVCRRRPLDPSILASLPVTVVRCRGASTDCAVCISELAEGEEARFLPECGHGFHAECIDMWFGSDSTCPLCRVQVGVGSDEGSSSGKSSSSGKLAVPSDSALAPAPMERLRSVTRAWTRGFDIEQGLQS